MVHPLKPRKSRLALAAILLLLIALLALVKMIPLFLDKDQLRVAIEKGLRESTGVHFNIRQLTVESTLFHGLQVNLNTNEITDLHHKPLGNIDNITVQIRYLPLFLRRTPEIAKIHINHIYLPVSNRGLLSEFTFNFKKPKPTGFIKPAEMKDTEVLVTNYLVEDLNVQPDAQRMIAQARQFRVEGRQISIKHLQSKKPVSIVSDGNLVFTPGADIAQAGERKSLRILMGAYKVMAEIPQSVFMEGHKVTPADLGRLNLNLNGPHVAIILHYLHKKDQDGLGDLNGRQLNLMDTQVLALQLADTIGFALPEGVNRVYLAGNAAANGGFRLEFSDPYHPQLTLNAKARLRDVAVARPQAWPVVMLSRINGEVAMAGEQVRMRNLDVLLSNLPLRINGLYGINSNTANLDITGNRLRVTSLRQTLAQLGVSTTALQGRDLNGLVDFTAHVTGSASNPAYKGILNLHNGSYRDPVQGIVASNINGRVNFSGAGIQNSRVLYNGQIVIPQGQLISTKAPLSVGSLDGKIDFNGAYIAGTTPVIPRYTGFINVHEAHYKDPQTGLLAQRISGMLRLASDAIHLENFRGYLGSTPFYAQGAISSNLKQYNVHVTGHNINLQRFKNEVLAKLPQAQGVLLQLQPYSGQANLDMTVSTGAQLNGRIDVSALALRTGQENYPIRVPGLSLVFNNQRVTVPGTTVFYGPVALQLAGYFQRPGTYQFKVASNEIPTEMLRDHAELISALSGLTLPEVWNTSGGFGMNGVLSNKATNFTVDFNDVGLSWQNGDFPLYGLNGRLFYKQAPGGKPVISTRNLNFRYGNSPVALDIQNQNRFMFTSNGVLSALAVNHFLVSPQTEATPYREIPFHAAAAGILASLPAEGKAGQNDVVGDIQLDLNPNFKYKQNNQTVERDGNANGSSGTPIDKTARTMPDMVSENTDGGGSQKKRSVLHLNPISTVKDTVGLMAQKLHSGLNTVLHHTEALAKKAIVEPVHAVINTRVPEPAEPSPATALSETTAQAAQAQTPQAALAIAGNDDNAYLTARVHLLGANLSLDQALLHMFDGGNLLANGSVTNVFNPDAEAFNMRFFTSPELSLDRLSHSSRENDFFRNASGTLGMDLQITGNAVGPNAFNGWVATNKAAVPYLTLQDLTGKMTFAGQSGSAEIANFSVPGVITSLSATTENIFDLPVTLENVKIDGSLLSIESLTDFNDKIVGPILIGQLGHNFLRPQQQGDPALPIQFRNAPVHFDEAIYQNILMSNLTSNLSVYANSFFELTNTQLEAAGGKATGYLSMNPHENNFMTLELDADKVSANALTRALLNVTNQIFGDLQGVVRFSTYGASPDEMQTHANGTVKLKVENGRLPAIARVETLLTAANVFRGGLLGLNLNNLFRSLKIYDTNYFATLSGDMQIANRVLYTDNLLSDGKDLKLFMQGSLRMDTGSANMLVNGTMSQNVSGQFGALGKLSLGSLVQMIPALGTFGKNQPGLLEYIPGVGYIPGFGGPATAHNGFQVRLVGPLDSPAAVQDFHWVRSRNL